MVVKYMYLKIDFPIKLLILIISNFINFKDKKKT